VKTPKLNPAARLVLQSLILMAAGSANLQAATWTKLTQSAPASVETMMLMTDGTVLAHSYDNPGNIWQRLTPSATGSYVDGTWQKVAPMGTNMC
jgi:hypothetical protein